MDFIKDFIKEEDGMGTIEIVVIIAVLLGVALLFQETILGFVKDLMEKVFEQGKEKVNVQTGN